MTLLQETDSLKKTPLYDRHLALHGKIVNFSGWALPVYYSSIIEEHLWVRRSAGLFDVSHLGEIRVKGKGAFAFLQKRLTNDLSKLSPGGILYNLLCDENGRTLDDVLVYQGATDDFYVIVNAANISKDFEALAEAKPGDVQMTDQSDETACLAVQGPESERVLKEALGFDLRTLGYYRFKEESFRGEPVWVSRSGYTGEDGFEIFSRAETAPAVWDELIAKGSPLGLKPAGLGARNTLRLEAGNALYGNDIDETTTPLEAGLGWAVSFTKGEFTGRAALLRQKESGVDRRLVGFKVLDRAVAREHYPIYKEGEPIGVVTSGSFAPSVGGNIGLAYVQKGREAVGTRFEIEIHGRRVSAEVVKLPFVPSKHKKG